MNNDQHPTDPQETGLLPEPSPQHPAQQQAAATVARAQVDAALTQDQPATDVNNPYARTHHQGFDWRTYHSAWQDYYKEYYRRYYQAISDQQAGEAPPQPEHQPTPESLKQDLLQTVKTQAHKFKKSSHFLPVLSALAVGCLFLFLQFNSIFIAQVRAYVSPGALEGQNLVITNPTENIQVGPEPRLVIPKINVDIPVNYDVTALDDATVQVALRDAAVHYKLPGADSVPGQFGNVGILGHSSNDVFAAGSQKFALVLADHLEPGDSFYLHYGGLRYTYKVTEKKVINPNEVGVLQVGYDKPMATLITCTPPGTALKRLLVFGEQINPDPAGATKPAETTPDSNNQSIPGNSPTLLEQIWGLFF